MSHLREVDQNLGQLLGDIEELILLRLLEKAGDSGGQSVTLLCGCSLSHITNTGSVTREGRGRLHGPHRRR